MLGLVEIALSFVVIYLIMQSSGAPAWMPEIVGRLPGSSVAPAAVIALSIGAIGLPIGLYQPEVCFNRRRVLPATCLAGGISFAALLCFRGRVGDSLTLGHALEAARLFGAGLATMMLIRLSWGLGVVRTVLTRRLLLLGDATQAAAFDARVRAHRGRIFERVVMPVGEVSWLGLRRQGIWGVVVAGSVDAPVAAAVLDCKLRGMPVFSGAAFHEHYLARIDLDQLTADGMLGGDGFTVGRSADALKRLADVVIGIAMLALTVPAMAVAALAIKLDSPGPVFYRQQRAGRFGKPFTIFKFRSMRVNAEAGGKPRWAQTQDPRITRVGHFLRACRMDELPQLANIIRGDMSLVGPRPERPHFVEQLAQAIPFYPQRAYVKPGLTGWAQVNYPYGASVEDAREKLAYDLFYVKHRSVWLDLVILLSTIRVVLFRDGAR
jgi:exopolysaccharide biosynthesis polyprenyl glycosylphosphotransferase